MRQTTNQATQSKEGSDNRFPAKAQQSELSGPLGRVLLTFLCFCGTLLTPCIALAALQITHVEYDPPGSDTGREWVEITNKGDTAVDVSKFKFLEAGVNHKLTLASGSALLAPGAAAIIASDPNTYLSDHSDSAANVFKSSFSLSNTGEELALVNASGTVEYTISYTAALKPAAAPAKKASTKTTTTKSKATSTKAIAAQATSYDNSDNSGAVIQSVKNIPPMIGWAAGLAAIVALGIAGALYARAGSKTFLSAEPSADTEEEFSIVEN
ncbi:MAG TPA: lamin tail domain-containing protein [Candidatus Paceibacterota bacterium]|nr:lamin tail domain-containing protein [Candidatus Paceibacterota bacterium]